MRKAVIGAVSAFALVAGMSATGYVVSSSDGVHNLAGRANVHSGGRVGGFANKRVGCGGCADHPASYIVPKDDNVLIQTVGRTNVHSDSRSGGQANPRLGEPPNSTGWPKYPKVRGWL